MHKTKPSHETWVHWAEVVIARLTTCVHVYSKPPHPDVFMAEGERQAKNAKTLDLLRRIHALTDASETPTGSLDEADGHEERVIAGLVMLLRDALGRLPELSTDMQKLLKSPWHSKCAGRIADELFRGPGGHEVEGIGTGHPENGRLPESLKNLLEQEQLGDSRPMREPAAAHELKPHRQEDGEAESTRKRWVRRNSGSLRSAGRVE